MTDNIPSALTQVISRINSFDEDHSSSYDKNTKDRFEKIKGDSVYIAYGYVYDKQEDKMVLYPDIVVIDDENDKYYPRKIDTVATFEKIKKDERYETLLDDYFCVAHGDGDVYDRYKNGYQHIIMCEHNGRKFLFYEDRYAFGSYVKRCSIVNNGEHVDKIELLYAGISPNCNDSINNPICVCTTGDNVSYIAEPKSHDLGECREIYRHKIGEIKNIFYSKADKNSNTRASRKCHLLIVNKHGGISDVIVTDSGANEIVKKSFTGSNVLNIGDEGEVFCVLSDNGISFFRFDGLKLVNSKPIVHETEEPDRKYNALDFNMKHRFSFIREMSRSNGSIFHEIFVSDDITHDIFLIRYEYRDKKISVFHFNVWGHGTFDAINDIEKNKWKAITWENGKYIGHIKCVLRRYSNDGVVAGNEPYYGARDEKLEPFTKEYYKIFGNNTVEHQLYIFGGDVYIDIPYLEKNSDGEYVFTKEFKDVGGGYLINEGYSLEPFYAKALVTRNSIYTLGSGKLYKFEMFDRNSEIGIK